MGVRSVLDKLLDNICVGKAGSGAALLEVSD